jgi:cytochrome b involved in lipid metabolism
MNKFFALTAIFIVGIIGLFLLMSEPSDKTTQLEETVQESAQETPEVADNKAQATYSLSEIANHDTKEDCWTTIDGIVYDLTSFVQNHPGGEAILTVCGTDGTEAFKNQGAPQDIADEIRSQNNVPADTEFHSPDARQILESLKIGVLVP